MAACEGLPRRAVAADYDFDLAIQRGVVDFIVNPWARANYDGIVASIRTIDPGLINRLGFQYGGVTLRKLDYAAAMVRRLKASLPKVRIGGGFPENLTANYSEALPCGGSEMQTFSRLQLTGRPVGHAAKYYWIDLSLEPAQTYYICIGKAQIDRGFSHLHFEEADNVVKQSGSSSECIDGYARVRDALVAYGRFKGIAVSFSGEAGLSTKVPLDAIYVPARFYENSFDTAYRSRVTTATGNGYTYALSPAIVEHFMELVPPRTKVLFYVDNFDYRQDDLRRMMELDAQNRRSLITRSAKIAHAHGAVFVPSLDHCDGCVPSVLVGDPCEMLPGRTVSYYDASACGDIGAISLAMKIQR